jgi:putative transposase
VLVDETGCLVAPLVRRTQAPRGKTPILKQRGRHREKVSVIAALSLSPGRKRVGLYAQTHPRSFINSSKTALFLRQLLRHLRGRVILVWDRGNMHKGPPIRKLLADYPRLDTEFLPPYAPDLNPVEHLWRHLKLDRLVNFAPDDADQLDNYLTDYLDDAKHDPRRLKACFRASKLKLPKRIRTLAG